MPGRALVAPKDIERLCSVKGRNKFRSKIALWQGDITRLEFDAIVNAANVTLRGGGGVDGAIHAAAGRKLLKECIELNGCKTGEAKITKGYKLPAKHVIHTVGPIGERAKELASCYHNSLNLMLTNNLKTIAFPCISTGIYGYPNESAAKVALETTKSWLEQHSKKVDLILFCLFLPVDVKIYHRLVEEYFPGQEIHHGGGNASSSVDELMGKKEDNSVNTEDTPSSLSSTLTNEIAPMKIKGTEFATTANKHSDGNSPNRGDSDNLKETREHKEENEEANKDNHKIEDSNSSGIIEGVQAPTRDIASKEVEGIDSETNESKHSDRNSPKESGYDGPEKTIESQRTEASKENEDPSVLSEEVRAEWIKRFRSSEVEAHGKVICTDAESWVTADRTFPLLKMVGGLDISYHVTKPDIACVSMVVLSFPELEVVHEDTTIENVNVPYIPGYLAYREAKHFQEKIKKAADAGFAPQITLVDGNGILHPRKFGSAVHVGVSSDVPTIGVAKNLLIMEEFGIKRDDVHTSKIEALNGKGSSFDMITNDNQILGKALLTSGDSKKPVYVSVGHRCSLNTATNVTLACSKVRVPEPIRQADHRSKLLLRKEFKEDYTEYHANK